jgi:hypothetical protein
MSEESWDSLRARLKGNHSEVQVALVDFLEQDLTLAFTLLKMLDPRFGPVGKEHAKAAISEAQAVLKAVRRLEPRIKDDEIRDRIQQRADELEAALSEVSPAEE